MLFECYFSGNFVDGKDISGFEFLKIQFLKQKLIIVKSS